MKIYLRFFSLILCIINSNCSGQNSKSSENNEGTVQDSVIYLNGQSYDLKALSSLDSLTTKRYLDDSTDYVENAIILLLKGESKLAIDKINEGLRNNSNDADAINLRGCAYYSLNLLDLAFKDFDKAISLNKNNEIFYYNRGLIYLKQGVYKKCIKDFSKVILQNPKNKDAYFARALAYEINYDFKKAISDYTININLSGGSTLALNNRAKCNESLNLYDAAFKDYDLSLKIDSTNSETLYKKGLLLISHGQINEGCALMKKAKQLGYNNDKAINAYCD